VFELARRGEEVVEAFAAVGVGTIHLCHIETQDLVLRQNALHLQRKGLLK
jgi:hypothetical protein